MKAEATKEELELKLLEQEIEVQRLKAARYELQRLQWQREVDKDDSSAEEHGVYTVYGEIGSRSVLGAIQLLDDWSRRKPGAPLKIIFNSPGGSVTDGFAFYDFIQELKVDHEVTTVAIGMAASMGGILLQAGHKRIMGPNTFMLIHEISAGAMGKISEMEDDLKFYKKLEEKGLTILANRSKLSKATIKRRWKSKDWWISAQEALEFGFIDGIR